MRKHFLVLSFLTLPIIFSFLALPSAVLAINPVQCNRYAAGQSNGNQTSECCSYKEDEVPDTNIWGIQNDGRWCTDGIHGLASGFLCYCRVIKNDTPTTTEEQTNQDIKESDPLNYIPQVSIPGSDSPFTAGKTVVVPANTQLLAGYIIAIFKYSTGIVGIIAIIVVMVGGVRWLTAAGGAGVSEAKTMIISGVSGLALTLGSFLLLSTINTSLVNFKVQPIKQITKIDLFQFGCCEKVNSDGSKTTENLKDIDCRALTGYKQVVFRFGYKADANECKPDSKKQACCLYGYDKKNNIPGLCRSKLMANAEALNNFGTECKGLADQVDEDKYIKGIFSIEASKECRDDKNTGIAKCINPE